MKKSKRFMIILCLMTLLISVLSVPAFAVTESEVEAQVAASGKEAVTGNVLIWFLCAVAFLKVSQKIDSFLATLGVNVGRTGGSMLSEAMIAMRAVTMVAKGGQKTGAGRAGAASGSAAEKSGSSGMTGFFKGGLVGMAGRHITNSAINAVTTQASAVHSTQKAAAASAAAQTRSDAHINSEVHAGGSSVYTENVAASGTPPQEGSAVVDSGASTQPIHVDNMPPAVPAPDGVPPQNGEIAASSGAPAPEAPAENAMPFNPIPDGTSFQEGVIFTGDETGSLETSVTPAEGQAAAEPIPDGIPSQAGISVGGVGVSAPADSVENVPFVTPASDGMPLQEGVIETCSGAYTPAVPGENTPSANPGPAYMTPQEGVIVTNSGAFAAVVPAENIPPVSSGSDYMPSQDGVILTGSEAPPSVSQADSAPQAVDTPPEDTPPDMAPPNDGIIITEGGSTVHAAQTGNVPHDTSIAPSAQENAPKSESVHHTDSRTERVSQGGHTVTSSERVQTNRFYSAGASRHTLGGMVFSRSLAAGGSFANDVIGTVARGEVAGSITGDLAAQSLQSYLGHAAGGRSPLIFSNAEIGRGRITGQVSTPDHPQPIAFGMYHVDQYVEPAGTFSKIRSADGTLWYTQLAQDAVERKPYKAPDDRVAYHERIVKKLPDAPKRKDRI